VYSRGGVITGFEGDTILACFGSPLDRSPDPLNKACMIVRELLNDEKNTWRFGIDAGECTFFWTAETGYSVNGRPGVRARMLASKTIRLKVRALVTDSAREKLNIKLKKMDSLHENSESVYEFS
jgi:class 3 adenylate cyclase